MEYNNIRRLLSCARRAADEYHMIEEGDRIAVGISGGKDSIATLCTLDALRRFYPKSFSLMGITVDMGLPGMDFSPVEAFFERAQIPYRRVETELAHIIFDVRRESNPCSLCAKMRRGILHDAVLEAGFNKIALGHHFDDVVDTFMLNLLHEGRLGSFSPVTHLSRKNITMIRPMILAQEKDIRYFLNHNELPIVRSACPEDKNTEREAMKELLHDLEHRYKGVRHRIFVAMQKAHLDGY